jgi:hypothetical protein
LNLRIIIEEVVLVMRLHMLVETLHIAIAEA